MNISQAEMEMSANRSSQSYTQLLQLRKESLKKKNSGLYRIQQQQQ